MTASSNDHSQSDFPAFAGTTASSNGYSLSDSRLRGNDGIWGESKEREARNRNRNN